MLENVNLADDGGPNSFAKKLVHEFDKAGIEYDLQGGDVSLCFIESLRRNLSDLPLVQRLDGIYFNTVQPYEQQNANIKRTYEAAKAVIFQSEFNKRLTEHWFGEHKDSYVIHNGANMDFVASVPISREISILDACEDIWCCVASWRPHKRLRDNIRYFFEHCGPKDILFVAGNTQGEEIPKDSKIKYLGVLNQKQLIRLYKTSTKFIHLAWLDHCPNVVVDARACGCHIICTNSGGTQEIAGPDATIIEQELWDFSPINLYDPPPLNFSKKIKNSYNVGYNMVTVAEKYLKVLILRGERV